MKIRKRKGRGGWVCDYIDSQGKRHQKVFDTKEEADSFWLIEGPRVKQRLDPVDDADITVAGFFQRWLERKQKTRVNKPSTLSHYETTVRLHIVPAFGDRRLRSITDEDIFDHLSGMLKTHQRATVRQIGQVWHSAFRRAIVERLVIQNPARSDVTKELKLIESGKQVTHKIKAMTPMQSEQFLATALAKAPDLYPLLLFMARTGVRPGEAFAAQYDNLTLHPLKDEGSYYITQALSSYEKAIGSTKTPGSVGHVQFDGLLARVLREHIKTHPGSNPLLFPMADGGPFEHKNVNDRFKRILRWAGLPKHFSPHCLRHTYASQALALGDSVTYVQQQLRHSTITLTADLYGRWLPKETSLKPGALDSAAARSSQDSKAVGEVVEFPRES